MQDNIKENISSGWISIYRSIQKKGWYKKSEYTLLWIHIVMKANHKNNEFWFNGSNIKVKRGQFVTGRKILSQETGISEGKIDRILKTFENEQQIKQQTSNRNRLISILLYDLYQPNEQQTNSKRTTSEQPVNTNNNDNNDNNDNNKSSPHLFKNSKYFSLEILKKEIGEKYSLMNLAKVHEEMFNWSEGSGKKKKNWLYVARAWINKDPKKYNQMEVIRGM